MNEQVSSRYVPSSQIVTLHNGAIYRGKDIVLNRQVLLYKTRLQEGQNSDTFVRTYSLQAGFQHEGFHHILDTVSEDGYDVIILQSKPGILWKDALQTKHLTFDNVINIVSDLGVSILDALETQVTGFSLEATNLWLGENGRLSVINYWDNGESQAQGAIGLCRVCMQFITQTIEIPGPFETLHAHLERQPMPTATAEQKQGLIKLVKQVGQGQASLPTFIFGLRKLLSTNGLVDEGEALPSIAPIPIREARKFNSFPRANITVLALVLIAVFITWALWPSSSSKSNRHVSVTPSQTAKPLADPSVSKQPPAQITATPTDSETKAEPKKEAVIPNLVGLSQVDAENHALAAGLHYNFLLETNSQAKGTVTKQEPAAGTKGMQGDNVTFWISKGNP
ncbi:PASTA domain-containing protein [Paenibacillus sp. SYP-B3998]|uniref:PASTA domain-containing protein n=1 Tax=Paenibacillus sp. SYP-B3998 TaxID=2678564 RepID=A0A6G3ZSK2_9BACL|nr:Stk1 family PASTA domain-containing Ser/Thr kinase [Paenibacillus sp. SYP-B3998]NEW05018.1 PASTA domain-containing protein [Paenibacillus sp. SYP-B3998]